VTTLLALRRSSGRARRAAGFGIALAVAMSFGTAAYAEPTAADKETARGLMATGRKDRGKGDLQGALKAFTAADAIMHVPTTGLEVARSQAALGLLVEARDTALQVARSPSAAGEPAPFKAARDAASSLGDELAGRIPSLTVTVKNAPEGATTALSIDGVKIPAEATGEPRKLNPGHHVVTARAGTAEGKEEVDLAEQESKTIAVTLGPGDANAAAATSDATPAEPEPPAAPEQGRPPLSRALVLGGFGLAGVGVVVGTVTGILSLSKTSSIKGSSACEGSVCNPSEDGDISSAHTTATISTVAFVAAGAGAAAGVVGLLLHAPSATPDKEQPTAWIEPTVGLGMLGVRGRF
jgi:hypothetical protein